MTRSPKSELAERINVAFMLLRKGASNEEIVVALSDRYGVKRRQAYRYIQEAQKTKSKLSIPEQKEVFTVKLPISLIFRVRELGKSTGQSLSSIITQALNAFLKRKRHG